MFLPEKTTNMNYRYSTLFATALLMHVVAAQYCTPTFPNGCFSWQNQQVTVADLDWITDGVCEDGDRTELVATMVAGEPTPMSVRSGTWTGCAVWIDLNNDLEFSDAENMHYEYVGGDPDYTYNFTITIPMFLPAGQYRMRVIAGWGSDGFLSTNTNGFGPCGDYQYGNYNDFTILVEASTGISSIGDGEHDLKAWPNPITDFTTIEADASDHIQRINVWNSDGRLVREIPFSLPMQRVTVDLSDLPAGLYHLNCVTDHGTRIIRRVKL
ncbi:MAG: T9SS type A sorting domain-containing protein [Bacteroidota bacterium]|nr:T9SS type A sorting domain-containing protein [Bacteroidota bacterium]